MSEGVEPLVRVTVSRESEREFEALTRRAGDVIELLPTTGRLPVLRLGERLGLHRPVAGDAMYEEPVVVDQATERRAVVRAAGERRRHQQRDHVRVTTQQLLMELDPVIDDEDDASEAAAPVDARVLDISAGGARIEYEGDPLEVGDRWHVRAVLTFDDSSTITVDEVAEVRWAFRPDTARSGSEEGSDQGDQAGQGGAGAAPDDEATDEEADVEPTVAGLRFVSGRPGFEAAITKWVFQQQAKWLRVRRQG